MKTESAASRIGDVANDCWLYRIESNRRVLCLVLELELEWDCRVLPCPAVPCPALIATVAAVDGTNVAACAL